jgi:hypothetical protein
VTGLIGGGVDRTSFSNSHRLVPSRVVVGRIGSRKKANARARARRTADACVRDIKLPMFVGGVL